MKENVINGLRHSMTCAFVQDRTRPCDCTPLDDSKAMRGADVLRIFKPFPPEEAATLRQFFDD